MSPADQITTKETFVEVCAQLWFRQEYALARMLEGAIKDQFGEAARERIEKRLAELCK